MQIRPYLFFDGRCDEAIEFYQRTLGARTEMLMRFADSPETCDSGEIAPGMEQKVMHAELRIGESVVMVSDGRSQEGPKFDGFALTVAAPDSDAAQRLFSALAEGGQVHMPMGETFFALAFGMAADKFGIMWMVIVPKSE